MIVLLRIKLKGERDMRPRVLLLNPPHGLRVVRDCYCSDVVKAGYYWQPLDLVVQAALLAPHAEMSLIDAVAAGFDGDRTLRLARAVAPDWVLCLVGDVVETDDRAFVRRLREALPAARLIASGDCFVEDPVAALESFDALDGALLDFSSPALSRLVGGSEPRNDLVLRRDRGIERLSEGRDKVFQYSAPPKGLFDPRLYRLPFYGGEPIYSLLASFGCPFRCRFCHLASFGYKHRNPAEVAAELEGAYAEGYRHFYIRDATFAVRRDVAFELCERISAAGLELRWNCFTRADLLDEALLDAMARSGCAVIQLGAETLDRSAAERVEKGYDVEHLRRIVSGCRRRGILTSLHFVIGLPGDSWITSQRAASDLITLDPDYISVNVLNLRPGTPLKGEGLRIGREEGDRYRAAARRLNMRFYLRPRRIAAELKRLKDPRRIVRMAGLFASSLVGPVRRRPKTGGVASIKDVDVV